jgi:hypothetical protein
MISFNMLISKLVAKAKNRNRRLAYSCNLLIYITLVILLGCSTNQKKYAGNGDSTKTVEVRYVDNKYQLYRHGKPYFIKGAGGNHHFDRLQANGGNSIRVWNTNDAKQVLDEAQKYGLTVTLGLEMGHPRKGFDYSDNEAVEKQLQELTQIVKTYKDHPALLMWGVGNELNYLSSKFYITDIKHIVSTIKVWQAVNDIAAMIHQVDPNHPTTTMLAGPSKVIELINYLCPEIDVLSINIFGSLPKLSQTIQSYGWTGPYIVTEWGPTGYWEAPRTSWDVSLEETSTRKAQIYKERYEASIGKDTDYCLGSYVFMWDVKQERTHTWFSMFIDSGEELSMVDALHYLWTGKAPENSSPVVEPLRINGKLPQENVVLDATSIHTAYIKAFDAEDSLQYRWEVLPELTGTELKEGGEGETKPEMLKGLFVGATNQAKIQFRVPPVEGAYRMFVYVLDGHHHVATANIPFYVIP